MTEKDLNNVSYICLALIIIAFIISLCYVLIEDKKGKLTSKRRWIDQIPSLLSTLGVLGTFFGITVGLVNFDTQDLDNSIPLLLAGLKTAFFTSLAGMVGSLILSRVVNKKFDDKDKGNSDIDIAAGKICDAVVALQNQSQQQYSQQLAFFNAAGTTLSTLASQLSSISTSLQAINTIALSLDATTQSIRTATSDVQPLIGSVQQTAAQQLSEILNVANNTASINHISESLEILPTIGATNNSVKENIEIMNANIAGKVDALIGQGNASNDMLEKKFDEFSELLKKSNTEALVEVMKGVSEEFEKQMSTLINKLIQENFEQLNHSVQQLNQWQIENKEMIESLTKKYKEMETSFDDTSNVLTKVSDDTKSLVGNGGKLGVLVETLNKVMIDDKRFIEITDNLKNTVDLTKNNMAQFEESTHSLNDWVKKQREFVVGVNLLIAKLDELSNIRNYSEEFWRDTKKSLEEGVGFITEGARSLNGQLTELDRKFYNRLSATLAELDTCIQAMVKGIE